MKRIAVKTLGCKLNQYDSQMIAEPFLNNGYKWVGFDEDADLYIINTCTVTSRADYSSRQAISRALRRIKSNDLKKTMVIVTGCYAQIDPEKLQSIEGVDLVIGNKEKHIIYDILSQSQNSLNRTTLRTLPPLDDKRSWGKAITRMSGYSRAFIKIQDGCNSNCSYCIIPKARGREVSRDPDSIYSEIERLYNAGYNEIVLTGVHIGRYNYKGLNFPHLMEEILTGDGPRIRFSSIEPNEISDELVDAIGGKKRFCRHIHIPVQSGSDRILRLMRRGYRARKIKSITNKLKSAIYGITLGADFIVGFPAETDDDFAMSMDIALECGFAYLHTFTYSDRPGTDSSTMERKINPQIKSSRSKALRELSAKLMREHLLSNVGEVGEIIVESRKHRQTGLNTGISDNYLRAVFGENSISAGEFAKISYKSVGGSEKYQYLIGEKIND